MFHEHWEENVCVSSADYEMPFVSIVSYLWSQRHRPAKISVKPEYVLVGLSIPSLEVPTCSYEELLEGEISCSGDPSSAPWDEEKQW